MDFADLKVKLPVNPINPEVSATINYGVFVQTVIEFVIIAFCVFLLVKGINIMARKKKDETPAAPPAPSKEELLLTEIRDILKNK